MSFFTWNDKFSVGIESIDREHKVLVDLIDQLHEAFVNGNVATAIGPILSALVEYTHSHFDREEAMMAEKGYPDLAAHREVHRELRRQVEEVYDRFLEGGAAGKMGNEVLAFLHDWLYFHIMETDKDYVPFMKDEGQPKH
ncbi:MAG TPA: bacteriohemerythrin [Candidatus Sulfotelmatobacter sp.]|nr:bacteriohemerythrin [Candidatus Sulfotelmatobacter sp.]